VTDAFRRVRDLLADATEDADGGTRDKIESLREALDDLDVDARDHLDRVREMEVQIDDLADGVEGESRRHLVEAREHLRGYRERQAE